MVKKLSGGKSQKNTKYPDVITSLPEADIRFEGAKGWILQGETSQLLFFEFTPDAILPNHSHGYPQWGMVIEGKMQLTVDSKAKVYVKGDEYVIPSAAMHSAKFLAKTRVMDLFSETARYTARRVKSSF